MYYNMCTYKHIYESISSPLKIYSANASYSYPIYKIALLNSTFCPNNSPDSSHLRADKGEDSPSLTTLIALITLIDSYDNPDSPNNNFSKT